MVLGVSLFVIAPTVPMAQETSEDVVESVALLTPHTLRALVNTAEAGDALAQLKVAWAYRRGWGAPAMPAEAFRWCKRAADQGLAAAQYLAGVMYREGAGTEPDPVESQRLMRLAAEQEFGEAEYEMGLAYFDGVGVEQDHPEAFEWFESAAEHGSVAGQTYLGLMYVNGLGVAADVVEGTRHLREAAEGGSPMAQANLGALYANGVGVEPDPGEALIWSVMAESGGFEGVGPLIAELTRTMSEEEITEIRHQARTRKEGFLAAESDEADTTGGTALDDAALLKRLEEIGATLSPALVELGTFSMDVIRDVARASVADEIRVRNTVSDVVLDRCQLRYVYVSSLGPEFAPSRHEVMVDLGAIDLQQLRVQPYQLTAGWRTVGSGRSEIYLAAAGYPRRFFVSVSPEGGTEKINQLSVPMKDRGEAKNLLEGLKEAARICGAQ